MVERNKHDFVTFRTTLPKKIETKLIKGKKIYRISNLNT